MTYYLLTHPVISANQEELSPPPSHSPSPPHSPFIMIMLKVLFGTNHNQNTPAIENCLFLFYFLVPKLTKILDILVRICAWYTRLFLRMNQTYLKEFGRVHPMNPPCVCWLVSWSVGYTFILLSEHLLQNTDAV